jgi:hypothetical protein
MRHLENRKGKKTGENLAVRDLINFVIKYYWNEKSKAMRLSEHEALVGEIRKA